MTTYITTQFTGQSDIRPRRVKIKTTDSFATITAAGYLNNFQQQGYSFYPDDFFDISYGDNISQTFTTSISSGVYTLEPSAQDVILPVVSGHFASFTGTAGALDDAGYLPSDSAKTRVVMATAATTSGNIAQFNDITGTVGNGPVAANKVLTSTVTPDVGANLIPFDVSVNQTALAAGGSVTLVASSGTKQYSIRVLQLNLGGTNFSGGGGNRLGQVTDGTTVFSVIPAATMQTLANAQWGATALPNPASAAIRTATQAGAALVFKYSGGTTDYTAGQLVISGIVEKVDN